MKDVVMHKKQISFRLSEELIERLKKFAQLENTTLNNYIETLLLEHVYNTPNEETLKVMRETERGEGLEDVDMRNEDAMWKTLGIDEED